MRIPGVIACGAVMLAAMGVASADEDAESALQKLMDRAEIEELVVRYVHALDTLDADAYEGVFTEDGVYELPGNVVHTGGAAIRKIVTDLQAARARNEAAGTPSPRLYHVMANSSIEIFDATNARHQSYAQTVRAADDGQFIVGFMGRYEDVLVKVDGRWRIKSRKLVSFVPPAASAQAPGSKTPEQLQAAYAEHKGDFDYLLGDWEFTAESKENGPFSGYWSAVRLAEGQILDEYRVVGDGGETFFVTTTIRSYNALLDQWELIGMDEGNGLRDFGTALRDGDQMHIEQRFGVISATPTIRRIRYYDIGADRFSWTSDLSRDNGSTWATDDLRIEARRIGPPRSLGALAVAPRASINTNQ
jgi:uncharacterized protein (TIGR02246 family)